MREAVGSCRERIRKHADADTFGIYAYSHENVVCVKNLPAQCVGNTRAQ